MLSAAHPDGKFLTADQMAFFEANGYLVVENVLDQEQVISIRFARNMRTCWMGFTRVGISRDR